MKSFLAFSLFLTVFNVWGLASPTTSVLQDTVLNDTLRIDPYFGVTREKALSNFAVTGKDKIAFQTYAGFSVLNTLRGHTPNFSIGPNTSSSTTGLRSGESIFVIDGLPFKDELSGYYNLNSFEYQNVYALSSGNATTLYGGSGSNGAFFLQSKTGENFTRPTFEFNSSTTQLWSETASLLGESEKSNQTILTNALAYQQDFGVIDTRVSYTYSFLPDGSTVPDTRSRYHNLRINTGFSIAPRFKARLILDDFYTKALSSQDIINQSQSYYSGSESTRKNLQGNLQLQYQVLDWLTLTSQSSFGKIEYNDLETFQLVNDTQRHQNRYFSNFYTSFQKSLNSDLSISSFAGFQYEKVKKEVHSIQTLNNQPYGEQGQTSEDKILSIPAGVGLQFRNYLFSTFNYRMDYVSNYAADNNDVASYSFNTSFVFSEAFRWENSGFSFGKMRMSIGKTGVSLNPGYPDGWTGLPVNRYPNPYLHASSKKMFEAGFDLEFIDNRLTLNTSYFSDHHADVVGWRSNPWDPNGLGLLLNMWDINTKGWELIVGGTTIKKNNFSMDTKLIWANYKTQVENANGESQGGGQQLLGNPNPDWTGSLLHQITYRGFFSSFLIDMRKGGDFITGGYSGGVPVLTIHDGTLARLRDLSIGYRLSSNLLSKLHFREAQVSLSGRNLWTIYSKSDTDVEDSQGTMLQKSATLSLSLMF